MLGNQDMIILNTDKENHSSTYPASHIGIVPQDKLKLIRMNAITILQSLMHIGWLLIHRKKEVGLCIS